MDDEVTVGHKFFDYGIDHGNRSYGLFCPALDQILFMTVDILDAIHLSLILSSKIHLIPVRIDTSKNFTYDLLDNSCCFRWTVQDKNQIAWFLGLWNISYDRIPKYSGTLKLKPADQQNTDQHLKKVAKELRNLLFLSYWVLKQFKVGSNILLDFGKNFIPMVHDHQTNRFYELKENCIKILYEAEDIQTVTPEIERIIEELDLAP